MGTEWLLIQDQDRKTCTPNVLHVADMNAMKRSQIRLPIQLSLPSIRIAISWCSRQLNVRLIKYWTKESVSQYENVDVIYIAEAKK